MFINSIEIPKGINKASGVTWEWGLFFDYQHKYGHVTWSTNKSSYKQVKEFLDALLMEGEINFHYKGINYICVAFAGILYCYNNYLKLTNFTIRELKDQVVKEIINIRTSEEINLFVDKYRKILEYFEEYNNGFGIKEGFR